MTEIIYFTTTCTTIKRNGTKTISLKNCGRDFITYSAYGVKYNLIVSCSAINSTRA